MILFTSFHIILVAAAVIPAVVLLLYIYREDRLAAREVRAANRPGLGFGRG